MEKVEFDVGFEERVAVLKIGQPGLWRKLQK